MVAGRLQNSGMLINRASDDAGRFAALLVAQQRRKLCKYELHRWNIAQHSGQLRQNC
jgi:hypothetical protein